MSFARARSDETAATVLASLGQTYASTGRQGLILALNRRVSDQRLPRIRYLLADPAFAPLAGNLANWPEALKGASGGGAFPGDENGPGAPREPSTPCRTAVICSWLTTWASSTPSSGK